MSETEEPHDILAAEEFSIPARENRIPSDPTGIREPHDVLAAEEFAMPAGAEPHEGGGGPGARAFLPLALAALVLLLVSRRRR
jgi:MYXO-CTERM domain-containing protein